jgi:hypothetical protein
MDSGPAGFARIPERQATASIIGILFPLCDQLITRHVFDWKRFVKWDSRVPLLFDLSPLLVSMRLKRTEHRPRSLYAETFADIGKSIENTEYHNEKEIDKKEKIDKRY